MEDGAIKYDREDVGLFKSKKKREKDLYQWAPLALAVHFGTKKTGHRTRFVVVVV